jgi:hypothetical protein
MKPLFDLDPSGGQVVVTRFECPNRLALLRLIILHSRVKRAVRRQARGYLGAKALVDWRRRSLLSVSLWDDIESIYSMGNVRAHIVATRRPGKMGIDTASGVYCFVGDWRRVLFRSDCPTRSPMQPFSGNSKNPKDEEGEMSSLPTDRGYVVVTPEGDGRQTVRISAEVTNGEAVGVYAEHVGAPSVVIHPEVELVESESNSFTKDVVEVFADEDGTVHVAAVQAV